MDIIRWILSWKSRWVEHLTNNSMTYIGHFKFATGHGVRCIKAGILLLVHGFMPCFYRKAGSKLVSRLNKEFADHSVEIQTIKK